MPRMRYGCATVSKTVPKGGSIPSRGAKYIGVFMSMILFTIVSASILCYVSNRCIINFKKDE